MKSFGISVGALGFAILVIAIDFAVIRAAFLSAGSVGWANAGARLLPHMLGAQFFSPRLPGWAVFAYFLLPMIDALLIGVYRLRRRGVHTARTVGSVIAGSVATLAVFTCCVISPGMAIGILTPISRRIGLASVQGLAWLFGTTWLQSRAMEWTYAVIFAILVPMAFFCILALLVAVIGRWCWHVLPSQLAGGADGLAARGGAAAGGVVANGLGPGPCGREGRASTWARPISLAASSASTVLRCFVW